MGASVAELWPLDLEGEFQPNILYRTYLNDVSKCARLGGVQDVTALFR